MYDLENLGDTDDHIGNSPGLHLLVHGSSHNLKRDQTEKKKKSLWTTYSHPRDNKICEEKK